MLNLDQANKVNAFIIAGIKSPTEIKTKMFEIHGDFLTIEQINEWLEYQQDIQSSVRTRIYKTLTDQIQSTLDLARTGLAPEALGLTNEQWLQSKMYRIEGELRQILAMVESLK